MRFFSLHVLYAPWLPDRYFVGKIMQIVKIFTVSNSNTWH